LSEMMGFLALLVAAVFAQAPVRVDFYSESE